MAWKCWIWYSNVPVVVGGTCTTTELVPVSMSPGLVGLRPRNWISNVGYLCERFDHTRMPPGSTPKSSGVSFGSARRVLGAVAGTAGVVRVPISCLALWEEVSGWNGPGTLPARNVTKPVFLDQHHKWPSAALTFSRRFTKSQTKRLKTFRMRKLTVDRGKSFGLHHLPISRISSKLLHIRKGGKLKVGRSFTSTSSERS